MTRTEYQESIRFYTVELVDLERRNVTVEFLDDGNGEGAVMVDNDRGTRLDILTPSELGAFFVGVRFGTRQTSR